MAPDVPGTPDPIGPTEDVATHRTGPGTSSQPRFRAMTQNTLWRHWGDELAVYEDRSAQTHLLIDGHAELFGLLAARDEALSIDEVAREFTGSEGSAVDEALTTSELASLQTLVHELVALGLVESVGS